MGGSSTESSTCCCLPVNGGYGRNAVAVCVVQFQLAEQLAGLRRHGQQNQGHQFKCRFQCSPYPVSTLSC